MAVLGIIILLAVAVVTATVVANGSDIATLNLVGVKVDASVALIYGVGALCLLLAVLGIFLMLGGAKRARRRSKEVRELRRQADRPVDPGAPNTPGATPPRPLVGQGGDPVRNERAARRHQRPEDDPADEHFRDVPRE